ncbi:hypothetical protein DER44DRAFT_748275 [Fusarium oxysporum]|nr:hypothetical protein DER44DRAFT_748275 [Fusarium oxysporum]
MAPSSNAVQVCEITKAGMGNLILMAARDQTSDIVSAQKQGHHGHELESTTTDDPNTEDNILPESSSTAMSDLGNVHALTQRASFDDQYLNQINSIDPLINFELGRLETPKQNAVLDNLSTPWNSEYFWHAYSPGMSSWNPGPDQVSPESSGEGAVDSSNNTLHTPGPSTAAGISGALVEELFTCTAPLPKDGWSSALAPGSRMSWVYMSSTSKSKKEGLRRVWWSVWELDTFSAAVACRPHTIDRMTMQVKLPVSDKNWFADMFVESSIINPDPVHSWHTLRDCPNQDERAWFLLINYLLLTAHDLGQQQNLQRKEIQEIEKAISCYTLILPPQFNLLEDLNPSSFRPNRVSNFNWIIVTNIMLQG